MEGDIEITQKTLMELDIDIRLAVIWEKLTEYENSGDLSNIDIVAAVVRAAYGQGYTDALSEPFGKLMRDNGYSPPNARFDRKPN